jgi:amino acid transporter
MLHEQERLRHCRRITDARPFRHTMSLVDKILGRPLASSEGEKEKLTVITGVPVLGLDALASTGYGPEAALVLLVTAGIGGLRYFPFVVLAILVELTTLFFSYQQTTAAYPNGGGAYIVAKDNLGSTSAVWAATALLLDYLLNVTVGISSGVSAVVSAIPSLHSYRLMLCIIVLTTLTLVNLRGLRESGLTFVAPVFVFAGCIAATILIGLVRVWKSGGNVEPVTPPPPIPAATTAVSVWLILKAFASGCTAMTGVEAVSNGVPLFKEPTVANARRTLTIIVVTLAAFLLGIAYLCPAYRIGAMDEQQPGYQTILSQLLGAVAGRGLFYYIASVSIFIVLTYSAQTSFTDFPRVCRFLAEDDYLPPLFANRGRRLVYSHGIMVLAIFAGVILIAFSGITDKLIPLFAVGAFTAFVFSQLGMVLHWRKRRGPGVRIKLVANAIGVTTTSAALAIIIVAKFAEGAWMVVLVAPAVVFILVRIHRHYQRVRREIDHALKLQARNSQPPVAIVEIESWNRVAEKALRFALLVSNEVIGLHITTENDDTQRLQTLWRDNVERPARLAGRPIPLLEIVESPYRRPYEPFLDSVNRIKDQNPNRLIAIVIPELVEPHWYEYLLHNLHTTRLRTLLYQQRDERTIVVNAPWYLRDG